MGPRTLARSAKGLPTRTNHDPGTQVVVGSRPTARSCRPACSLSQWANLRAPAAPQTGDPARNRRVPVGKAVEPGPPPKRLYDGGRVQPIPPLQRGQLQAPDFDLGSRRAGREYGGGQTLT